MTHELERRSTFKHAIKLWFLNVPFKVYNLRHYTLGSVPPPPSLPPRTVAPHPRRRNNVGPSLVGNYSEGGAAPAPAEEEEVVVFLDWRLRG